MDYDCGESIVSLGRIPLTTDYRGTVPIDGTGGDADAGQRLLFIYGAEIFWRAAMGESLPPTVAERLEAAAFGLSDADMPNFGGDLGVAGPIYDFVKIGRDPEDANVLGAMGGVFDLAQDQAVSDWLLSQSLMDASKMNAWVVATHAAARAVYIVQVATELGDLPLRFSMSLTT